MSTLKTKNYVFLFFLLYLCDTIRLVIYMFNILNVCNDYIIGNIIDIIRRAVNLLGIIVPILLIIGGTINIVKAVFNPEDKKVIKNIVNCFISAIIVFFLPFIINTTMKILAYGGSDIGVTEGGKTEVFSVSACWNNINKVDTSPKFSKNATKTSVSDEQNNRKGSTSNNTSSSGSTNKSGSSGSSGTSGTSSTTSTSATNKTYNKVVLVGDSRFAQQSLHAAGNSKTTYIAESKRGLDYVKEQINNIKKHDCENCAFVINMGVNDYWKNNIVSEYTTYLNNFANSIKGKLYFLSVNPVDEAKEKSTNQMYITTNASINAFNNAVRKGLNSKITYLDSNAYLKANGFGTVDGIHYDEATYKKIYNFIATNVKS